MRKCVLFAIGAIAAACLPAMLSAQTAKAWADSTAYVIGDPIAVHIELAHPEGATVTPLLGDTLGAFHVLSRDSIEVFKHTLSTTTFTVAAYDSGTAILPQIQFAISSPGSSSPLTVSTNPLVFTIALVEVDTTKDIKDVKPVVSIPYTVAEISLIIGTLVGIALLAYFIYRYATRKKPELPEERYVPPPKAAHVLALEELASLKEKRLWQQGLIKPYYSEATEIVRRYFENRFGFMSLEKTSDETIADLRRFAAAHPVLEQTDRILKRADLVKFAKYQPAIPEHEEMLTVAYEIIDKTRVIETPSLTAPKSEVWEAANG